VWIRKTNLLVHTTYEDGTDRAFRKVGTYNSDAGDYTKERIQQQIQRYLKLVIRYIYIYIYIYILGVPSEMINQQEQLSGVLLWSQHRGYDRQICHVEIR